MAKRLAVELFVIMLVGAVLGAFGPFGSFAMPTGVRFAFWIVILLAGYACFRPLIILGRWLSASTGANRMLALGLSMLVGALPVTFLVSFSLSGFSVSRALINPQIVEFYAEVWLICMIVTGLFSLLYRDGSVTSAQPAIPQPPAPVIDEAPLASRDFADRLPSGFGPLLALKGEDHYVRAIGEQRDALILIRMRDAVAELGDAGTLVHRSWWVARDAIAEARSEGRTLTLTLANGTEIPVSRENASRLRSEGWLPRRQSHSI